MTSISSASSLITTRPTSAHHQGSSATLKHAQPITKVALASDQVKDTARETAASLIHKQQQTALLETAQQAFSTDAEDNELMMPTGEIAKEAAKHDSKQALAFQAVERILDHASQRPRIQEQA